MTVKYRLLTVVLFILILSTSSLFSQSAGNGDVVSIENKSNQIINNDKKVTELTDQRQKTYSLENDKLIQLRKAYNELVEEMIIVLDELRKGRFCNGCGRTARQLRDQGEYDVEKHFRDNGGTRPARPEEIKRKEDEYNSKIASKETELNSFQFGENEFTRKRADIDKQIIDLKAQNDRLRDEIIAHSKGFHDKVMRETDGVMKPCAEELMRMIATVHYNEDQVDVIKVKIDDLNREEQKAVEDVKIKVQQKNEQDKKDREQKVNHLKQDIFNLQQVYKSRSNELDAELRTLNREKTSLELKLKHSDKLEEGESLLIETRLDVVLNQIQSVQQESRTLKTQLDSDELKINTEIRRLNDEIWKLTISLSELQMDAISKLKEAFKVKHRILQDAKIAKESALVRSGELIDSKKNECDSKMRKYYDMVENERVRLVRACNSVGSGCFGTSTSGDLWARWSNARDCVHQMDHRKTIGIHYGCEEQTPYYLSYYNSLKSGMSNKDIEALQRSTYKTRYDYIFKKIN